MSSNSRSYVDLKQGLVSQLVDLNVHSKNPSYGWHEDLSVNSWIWDSTRGLGRRLEESFIASAREHIGQLLDFGFDSRSWTSTRGTLHSVETRTYQLTLEESCWAVMRTFYSIRGRETRLKEWAPFEELCGLDTRTCQSTRGLERQLEVSLIGSMLE